MIDLVWTENRANDGSIIRRGRDRRGVERSAVGYTKSLVRIFDNDYDDRGLLIKQRKWNEVGLLLSVTHYLDNYKDGLTTIFSPKTGAVILKANYKKDLLDGLCERYFENPGHETIRERAHYRAGRREGKFVDFHPNGNIHESGEIENGKYEGPRFVFSESGQVVRILRYENGELHGDLEEFHPNGALMRRSPHKDGRRHGIEEFFNPEGRLTSRACFIDGEGSKDLNHFRPSDGPVELFFENGTRRSLYHFKDGLKEGPYELYRAQGLIREKGTYRQDRRTGQVTSFDKNGGVAETACYLEGKLDGPKTTFYPSGEIATIENYVGGLFSAIRTYRESGTLDESTELDADGSGITRLYDENGGLRRETQVRSNYSRRRRLRHGYDRIYSKNDLSSESFYQSGLRHGASDFYSADGKLKRSEHYGAGRLISTRFLNPAGVVYRVLKYFPDGELASDEMVEGVRADEPADDGALKKGSLIGNYEVIRSIGHGGMGDVYLAREKNLERQVAVKTIRGEADAESRARFEVEGRALARISHKNIVTVYLIGEHLGRPYMAMEYVEGWPLSSLLGRGLLGFDEQMGLFRQMVDGMTAAHNQTILHRDLKPGNIIISKNFDVKIIDFGISKILSEDSGLTAPNVALGTIRYMAPEIAQGLSACLQTDVYSLGVILFEMLTGATPFNGANQLETLELIKTAPLEFPAGISEILPDALKSLISKMTAKRIDDRHANLAEVARDLGTISFDHLPDDFRAPLRRGLEIANLEEARRLLKEKGHSTSELSLILNLACRIQQRMIDDIDRTHVLGVVEDFVLSPEALKEATTRYEGAKKGLSGARKD